MLNNLLYKLAFISLVSCSTLLAQSVVQADRLGRPAWIFTPKPMRPESASNSESPSVRKARDVFFDVPGSTPLVAHDLMDYSHPSGGGADFYVTRDPLPTGISDVVAVVQVSSTQPFVSSDKSMVYSELYGTVLKPVVDKKNLLSSSSVVILQRGGTLQLPSGQVLSAMPYGGSNPIRIGTRYLLFLQYHPATAGYTVARAWNLDGSKPQELDDDGHPLKRATNNLEDATSTETNLEAYVRAHQP